MNHQHSHGHNFIYNESERRKILNPENILKKIELKEGMVFVDLGGNDGYFSIPAAKIVTNLGKVITLDIDEIALERLNKKANEQKISNIQTIHHDAETAQLEPNSADIVFLGTVLHDFLDPLKVLLNAKNMLKKDGIIYDLDWQKKDQKIGPPFNIRFSKNDVNNLANQANLKIISYEDISNLFYLIALQ